VINKLLLKMADAAVSTSTGKAPVSKEERQEREYTMFGKHLRNGFNNINNSKVFSDVDLVLGNGKKIIPSHRVILYAWSTTFQAMLEGENWAESKQKEIKVNIEEENFEMFEKMLEFMYSGKINVDGENCIKLLELADYYGVIPLKELCGEFLGNSLTLDNVYDLLKVVEQYSCSNLELLCADLLASRFGKMIEGDIVYSLDLTTWAKILRSDDIIVTHEQDIFWAVLKFCDQYAARKKKTWSQKKTRMMKKMKIMMKKKNVKIRQQKRREKALNVLLPLVRWTYLGIRFLLEHVEDNNKLNELPIVQQMLYELYRYKAQDKYYNKHSNSLLNIKPRRGMLMCWSNEKKSSHILLSNDDKTAKITSSSYSVVTVEGWVADGCFEWHVKIDSCNYVGVGIVSDSLVNYETEFHTTPNCCVYYYSNPFYKNYPNNTTLTASQSFTTGDIVTVRLDMDLKKITFLKKGVECISTECKGLERGKLGVLINNSQVSLVFDEDD